MLFQNPVAYVAVRYSYSMHDTNSHTIMSTIRSPPLCFHMHMTHPWPLFVYTNWFRNCIFVIDVLPFQHPVFFLGIIIDMPQGSAEIPIPSNQPIPTSGSGIMVCVNNVSSLHYIIIAYIHTESGITALLQIVMAHCGTCIYWAHYIYMK